MIPNNLGSKSFGTQSHLRIPITSNFSRMKFNMAQSLEIVKGTFWLDSIWLLHWDMFSFFVHSSRCKVLWLQMVLLPQSMDALVSKGGWLIGPEHPLLTGCAPHIYGHFCEVPSWNLKACLIVLRRRNSEWDRLELKANWVNLWRFLGAHIRTACGLSFWQVHRGESN